MIRHVRGKLGKPAYKDERALGDKPPVRTTAGRHSPRPSIETLFDGQKRGVKRKNENDLAGKGIDDGEGMRGKGQRSSTRESQSEGKGFVSTRSAI